MVAIEALGAFEAMASPRDLLTALEASAGRRLPLSLGGVAGDRADDGDDDDDDDDAPLRRHWLIDGGVVELCALPGAFALTTALRLALQARARARALARPRHLAVIDATGTLCAPALAHVLHGGDDDDGDGDGAFRETLVVRPGATIDAVFSCATRVVESGAVAAVVVDAGHLRDLSAAVVPCRRLLLAAEARGVVVALSTSPLARRPLPLPVAARADVDVDRTTSRPRLQARRHRHGLPPAVTVARPPSVSEAVAAGLRAPPTPTSTSTMNATTRPALELVAWS